MIKNILFTSLLFDFLSSLDSLKFPFFFKFNIELFNDLASLISELSLLSLSELLLSSYYKINLSFIFLYLLDCHSCFDFYCQVFR